MFSFFLAIKFCGTPAYHAGTLFLIFDQVWMLLVGVLYQLRHLHTTCYRALNVFQGCEPLRRQQLLAVVRILNAHDGRNRAWLNKALVFHPILHIVASAPANVYACAHRPLNVQRHDLDALVEAIAVTLRKDDVSADD
jgi:hypothetical protein